ncbi:hypothetical protein [Maridesulfovibrio sp.]|uniref:hypothetical protein n=1 Tax=Maridesulfovibrio sp. TaxID=2795000 RepID=UPI0029CA24E9|nr:hypothetical protein [Maridesulfovibrio sp.]
MDALEKFSALYLRAITEKAVLDSVENPSKDNLDKADVLCDRLGVYALTKAGAAYKGNVEGPRRIHG